MIRLRVVRAVTLAVTLALVPGLPLSAQRSPSLPDPHQHEGHHPAAGVEPRWEGSPEGKAYSEYNHHVAGLLVVLIGMSELLAALGIATAAWSRLLLPAAMLLAGAYLAIWSDHEAWPIGSLTFAETFFSGDWEMVQHKAYAVLLLGVGTIELWRRAGKLRHALWTAPLPVFAIVGGLMLFAHSHGAHPAAAKIAFHHTVLGIMAITAGACKLARHRGNSSAPTSPWELGWATLIILIGGDLLLYTE
jgi:putative copper resistance protein D